jgi:hypothetical protein
MISIHAHVYDTGVFLVIMIDVSCYLMQPSVRYMRGDMVLVVVLKLTLYRGPTFKF